MPEILQRETTIDPSFLWSLPMRYFIMTDGETGQERHYQTCLNPHPERGGIRLEAKVLKFHSAMLPQNVARKTWNK